MRNSEERFVNFTNFLVGGTGVALAVLRYGYENDNPFSILNHPWEPHALHAHIIVAPLLVFAIGLIWHRHIWPQWKSKKPQKRRSGFFMMATFIPLVLSAYAIQVSMTDSWRELWIAIHLVTAAIWLIAVILHLVTHKV